MAKEYSGHMIGTDLKVGVVVGRFNDFITNNLLEGAMGTLKAHGVFEQNIHVARVPGAFEIPLVAQSLAKQHYDVIITLGAVIRGSTPHFDYVCNEVAKGVSKVSLAMEKPVIFGVITTDTIEQAIERAGTTGGNKGSEAASAGIEMANLMKEITEG